MNRREMIKQMLLITAAIPVLGMGIVDAAPLSPTMKVKELSSLALVNQRHLLLKIRKTLQNIYMNFIEANRYEPLDNITRHKLQYTMKEALNYYHQATRQIYDFCVICDQSNNPPSVIDNSNLPVVDVALRLSGVIHWFHIKIGPSIT